MHTPAEPRVRKRVPCTIEFGGERRRALVLNLSRGGLFVQTSQPADPGTAVSIDVAGAGEEQAIALSGTVVWRRWVPARTSSTTQNGMGVRLESPPPAWGNLVGDESGTEATPPATPGVDYVVRLAQTGSPRTRRIVLRSGSEQEARERALAETGEGWEVLELSIR